MSYQYNRLSEQQEEPKDKKKKEIERGKSEVEKLGQNKEIGGVNLICIHYMLPDNKLQFNPRRGGSHSVVINK